MWDVQLVYSGTSLIQTLDTWLLRLSSLDHCVFYLMPTICTEQSYARSFEGKNDHTKMPEF